MRGRILAWPFLLRSPWSESFFLGLDMADAPTPQERRDAIARSVEEGVQSASVDGLSVNEQSLRERIEADKYLASQEAAKRNHRGLQITRLIPGGTGQ